jgi:Kef-type K+ transport system membrane component KefB
MSGVVHSSLVAAEYSLPGFVLFMATALSITAISILGRIMMEFGITRTTLGVLTISAAAVDDAIGWMLLAAVSAAVRGSFSLLSTRPQINAHISDSPSLQGKDKSQVIMCENI